jgi:hypothetical protein
MEILPRLKLLARRQARFPPKLRGANRVLLLLANHQNLAVEASGLCGFGLEEGAQLGVE